MEQERAGGEEDYNERGLQGLAGRRGTIGGRERKA